MIPIGTRVKVIKIEPEIETHLALDCLDLEGEVIEHYKLTGTEFNAVLLENNLTIGFLDSELQILSDKVNVDIDKHINQRIVIEDMIECARRFELLRYNWQLIEKGISKEDFFKICKQLLEGYDDYQNYGH